MRQVYAPAIVNYGNRLYRLSPDQWRRLAPQIKGLNSTEAGPIGLAFLRAEGIIGEAKPDG